MDFRNFALPDNFRDAGLDFKDLFLNERVLDFKILALGLELVFNFCDPRFLFTALRFTFLVCAERVFDLGWDFDTLALLGFVLIFLERSLAIVMPISAGLSQTTIPHFRMICILA